jgi:hypothetical protein
MIFDVMPRSVDKSKIIAIGEAAAKIIAIRDPGQRAGWTEGTRGQAEV